MSDELTGAEVAIQQLEHEAELLKKALTPHRQDAQS
jgi:hypothetical protein